MYFLSDTNLGGGGIFVFFYLIQSYKNFLSLGLGLLNFAPGIKDNIGDQIPVDFVVNGIITAAYFYANKKGVHVLHSGSSDKNPVSWDTATYVVRKFWRENPSPKSIKRPNFELVESNVLLKVSNFLYIN